MIRIITIYNICYDHDNNNINTVHIIMRALKFKPASCRGRVGILLNKH